MLKEKNMLLYFPLLSPLPFSSMATPPEDFRCPISLELMTDPVILSTGQTYDRCSIQRWIDSGHTTCPKTKQILHEIKLIPNYALRSLISQWAQAHGIDLKKRPSEHHPSPLYSPGYSMVDRELKTVVQSHIKSLSNTLLPSRRTAIKELRNLAKDSKENRACIVEEGAIARILPLLGCGDSQTQEIAMDALLNLSMDDENKVGMVAEGGVGAIVNALKNGSMDARCKAALTLISLAMVDVNKASIGRGSDAIPALVKLMAEGNSRGRKEAINALCSLCMYPDNRAKAVSAGVISLLLAFLTEGSCETMEHSLKLLDFLSALEEGKHAISRHPIIPNLVRIVKSGTSRSREHAAAIMWSLCSSYKMNTLQALNAGALEHCLDLIQHGNLRARRKASMLVKAFREFQRGH